MQIRGYEFNEKTLVLGLAAVYAAAVIVVLTVFLHNTVWHAVANAL